MQVFLSLVMVIMSMMIGFPSNTTNLYNSLNLSILYASNHIILGVKMGPS